MEDPKKKLRYGAMAATIAVAVGGFLLAQRLALIPGPWTPKTSAGYLGNEASAYTSAIDADPADYMTYYRRGILYQKQRRFDLALADFNQAVNLSPTPVTLEALGEEAKSSLSRDTHTLGLVFLLHTTRAEVLQQMNQPDEALADLDQAVALDPRGSEVFFSRGLLRAVTGRYDSAIEDFNVILTRRSDVTWHFGRGLAAYFKGDWKNAVADFRRATLMAPREDSYVIWLAKAELRNGTPLHADDFATLDRQSGAWPVIESFMSDHNPEQFISGVRAGAGYANPGSRDSKCKAALFLGEWLTLRKAGVGARELFTEAQATCRPLSIEQGAATAELRRLPAS